MLVVGWDGDLFCFLFVFSFVFFNLFSVLSSRVEVSAYIHLLYWVKSTLVNHVFFFLIQNDGQP